MKAEDSAEATGSGLAVMTGPPDADAEVAVKEVTGQGAAPPELEIAGQSAPVTQKQRSTPSAADEREGREHASESAKDGRSELEEEEEDLEAEVTKKERRRKERPSEKSSLRKAQT